MRLFTILLAALVAFTSVPSMAGNIIPAPRKYEKRSGVFTIQTTTKITHYPALRSSAEYLSEFLPLEIREYNEPQTGDIVIRENKSLDAEEYRKISSARLAHSIIYMNNLLFSVIPDF